MSCPVCFSDDNAIVSFYCEQSTVPHELCIECARRLDPPRCPHCRLPFRRELLPATNVAVRLDIRDERKHRVEQNRLEAYRMLDHARAFIDGLGASVEKLWYTYRRYVKARYRRLRGMLANLESTVMLTADEDYIAVHAAYCVCKDVYRSCHAEYRSLLRIVNAYEAVIALYHHARAHKPLCFSDISGEYFCRDTLSTEIQRMISKCDAGPTRRFLQMFVTDMEE
jgi:hypothetical protein